MMGTETDDLRADIESAMGGGEPSPEPTPASPPAPEPTPTPEPSPEPTPSATGRDALGRFVSKAAAAPPPEPGSSISPGSPGAAAPVPQIGAAAPAAPAVQAPYGWSAQAREHWAQVPAPVQEYIVQREQQMQRWASDTAPMRQAGERFLQAIQPHMMTIQAEGVDPFTAVQNLMNVGTTLRFGTPIEKARVIAECVQTYGVDIPTLDAALVGAAPPNGQQPQINVQAEVQRALQPLMQAAQQRQQYESTQTMESARQDLIAFASDPKHEFIDDVREVMADLIEVADRQGYTLALQDAYDRACTLHPEVSKVIMARQQHVNAQQLTQNAQRAKQAAVSVKGAPPVGNPNAPEPSSLRESIEAAIEAHSRV